MTAPSVPGTGVGSNGANGRAWGWYGYHYRIDCEGAQFEVRGGRGRSEVDDGQKNVLVVSGACLLAGSICGEFKMGRREGCAEGPGEGWDGVGWGEVR